MENNIEQKIKLVMSDILNIPEDLINESTASDNTDGWDSGNHIQLIVALEEEFSINFDVTEFESMLSYMDILELVKAKL